MAEERQIWTIGAILKVTEEFFKKKGIASSRLDAEVLLAAVLKKERIFLYVHFDEPLTPEEVALYRKYVAERSHFKPVAYILGSKEFMGWQFKVSENTLIPRPDTEILVEAVMQSQDKNSQLKILDLGTGSGAIIISLLKYFSNALGTAVDISPKALPVAADNAFALEVASRLTLLEGDMFSCVADRDFNIIVSNPPYIPKTDMAGLEPDVKDYEPHLALTDEGDGLKYYRTIFSRAGDYLLPGGMAAVEVGIHQAEDVAGLARANNWTEVEIIPDYAGIQRVVLAWKK